MVFKRKFLTFAFLIFSFKVFSQEEVPALLKGVWKNSSRYFVFDSGYVSDDGGAIPQAVLRSFYTWYDDRAAESSLYSEKNPRNVNNTTSKNPAQEISIKYVPLTKTEESWFANGKMTAHFFMQMELRPAPGILK